MIFPPALYWLILTCTALMALMIPASYWIKVATPLSTFAKAVCVLCGVVMLWTDDPFQAIFAGLLSLVSVNVSSCSESRE